MEIKARTWEELTNSSTPDWLRKAKFGIYTHWGVFEAFITAIFWAVFGIFTLNYAILKNRRRNRR